MENVNGIADVQRTDRLERAVADVEGMLRRHLKLAVFGRDVQVRVHLSRDDVLDGGPHDFAVGCEGRKAIAGADLADWPRGSIRHLDGRIRQKAALVMHKNSRSEEIFAGKNRRRL